MPETVWDPELAMVQRQDDRYAAVVQLVEDGSVCLADDRIGARCERRIAVDSEGIAFKRENSFGDQ